MSLFFLLFKDRELKHTYSSKLRDKLIKAGWTYVANINGWNATISYIEKFNIGHI